MKKVLCALLVVLLLLSLCACSNTEKPQGSTPIDTTAEGKTPEKETTTQPKETESNEETMQKFKFPLIKYFCDVPDKYGRRTSGKVAIVVGNDDYIATIYNGDKGDYTGDLDGILTFAADKYSSDTAAYLLADLDPAELKASNTEKVTVSGYDAVKFSGPVKNKSGNTYEIYGYSMIIEDRPVMFVGVLCSDDQTKADLDEMKALIDLMAGSIYK